MNGFAFFLKYVDTIASFIQQIALYQKEEGNAIGE
jgi:hypothetical protein